MKRREFLNKKEYYKSINRYSIHCSLLNVKPNSENGKWSPESIQKFNQLVHNNIITVTFKSKKDNIFYVDLEYKKQNLAYFKEFEIFSNTP